MLEVNESDTIYLTLPLYHSAACISLYGAMRTGATVVLRKKFSASHFWQDVRKYNVTIFQYIGELCRYLLAQKPSELDKQHKVRAIIGNGLRKDIWTEFQTRYGIPFICEFFAATDGNTLLFNASNKPGAIGRLSPFMRRLEPNPRRLVKYDYNTAEPVRDENGRCIEVDKPGEAGLFISFIPPEARNKPIYRAAAEATAKKIIRNAFVDGDEYYNYGDLLYRDKDYFLYFNDRIGDTFRWKGENVSTTEVANILTNVDFIQDANVYGVAVPGQDGRAGMAALTLTKDTNLTPEKLQKIYDYCEKELPRYARPIFLRNLEEDILTVTFKQKKNNIVKEGFNPMEINDQLFFRDEQTRTYIPLTADVYPKVLKAKL
ncbi:long-chain fatty acid transport protein 6 [Patella vulgata]|uniref:long-chain fatty acid transport protein 6 n=1 Tax=Patella vulgata TaxID=6465 RepID=UPI0024A80CD3|nr:long-chain fatty acid transport protein 6 [Patella vulgata]